MQLLLALYEPFNLAEDAAGLTLNPAKCNLIVGTELTIKHRNRIKDFLMERMPRWVSFNIVNHAKLLGYWVGPTATPSLNFLHLHVR